MVFECLFSLELLKRDGFHCSAVWTEENFFDRTLYVCASVQVFTSAKHGRHVKNVINFSFMFSDCSKVFACVFAYYIANDMHSIHCTSVGWMRERAVSTTKCYKHASICNDKHLTWKTISIVRVEISMWNVSTHTLTTAHHLFFS